MICCCWTLDQFVVEEPLLVVVLMVPFWCLQVAEDLMEKLGVSQDRLVTGAYMDLLLANKA